MRELIQQRLQSLNLQHFELKDDSHLHAGHAGNTGGGHYRLFLVGDCFDGVSRLERQRMVQNLLADLFANKRIHALSIRAQTPTEQSSLSHPHN